MKVLFGVTIAFVVLWEISQLFIEMFFLFIFRLILTNTQNCEYFFLFIDIQKSISSGERSEHIKVKEIVAEMSIEEVDTSSSLQGDTSEDVELLPSIKQTALTDS